MVIVMLMWNYWSFKAGWMDGVVMVKGDLVRMIFWSCEGFSCEELF